MENQLSTQTIKEFCTKKGFTQIVPEVRKNTNEYPFLTFIDANNVAENVYFSKAASKMAHTHKVDKDFLKTLMIGETTNAEGHKRYKLISNSNRVELADLLD